MNIENKYPVMIFRSTYENKYYYKMGLSKKGQDGKYINGYIMCRFKNGVELEDKTKLYIKNAWLDFYLKDKTTVPYIFISEFETVEETIDKAKTEIKEEIIEDPFEEFQAEIELNDDMLPF